MAVNPNAKQVMTYAGPLLAGGVTTLTALLAAFGGADVARRNHQFLLYVAVTLVLLALAAGAAAAFLAAKKHPNLADAALIAAMAALVGGLGVASFAALDHQSGQPLLDASLIAGSPMRITATVARDGLRSKDEMVADVRAFAKAGGTGSSSMLYRATFGPNEQGVIALSFQIPIPAGLRARSIVLRAWVAPAAPKPGKKVAQPPACTTGPAVSLAKYQASCTLIVLPAKH
jgi:hypothetical protein